MARFDRYMLRQLFTLFGFFALVLVLIYWINRAVVLFDQLIADGQNSWVFLELTLLSLPGIIRIVLPLSAFVAAVYVTNRLTSDSEMVVVQATGYSPFRLARPVMTFGVVVAMVTMVLTNVLVPLSITRTSERQAEIAETATARILQEGKFLSPTAGVTFYIREVAPGGELRDVFLSDTRTAGESMIYTATNAYLVRTTAGPQLVMTEGMGQTFRSWDRRLVTTSFTDLAYDIGSLMPPSQRGGRVAQEVPTIELLAPTQALTRETGRSAGELVAMGHDRFAQALLAIVGALIGFATLIVGGFSRFGLWRQIGVAVLLIVLVKLIEAGVVATVRADPATWPLIYLPFALGMVMAVVLLTLAARPGLLRRRLLPGRNRAAAPGQAI